MQNLLSSPFLTEVHSSPNAMLMLWREQATHSDSIPQQKENVITIIWEITSLQCSPSLIFFSRDQNNGERPLVFIFNYFNCFKIKLLSLFFTFLIFLKIFEFLCVFEEKKRTCTSPFYGSLAIWAETRDLTKASVFENWVKRMYIKDFFFLHVGLVLTRKAFPLPKSCYYSHKCNWEQNHISI